LAGRDLRTDPASADLARQADRAVPPAGRDPRADPAASADLDLRADRGAPPAGLGLRAGAVGLAGRVRSVGAGRGWPAGRGRWAAVRSARPVAVAAGRGGPTG